ncbi:MAG: prolyl oligopeptidase family serine peptidase, partial [Woeseia sp.]
QAAALPAPNGDVVALLDRPKRPSIADLARPTMRLAGLRFDAANRAAPPREAPGRARPSNRPPPGSLSPAAELEGRFSAIRLVGIAGNTETRVVTGLPENTRIMHPMWSPDGRALAFTVIRDERSELWITTAKTAKAKPLGRRALNSVAAWPCQWRPDSRGLLCRSATNAGPVPQENTVPTEPLVQEHSGPPAPARTFQNLLQSPHDEALLEHYLNSQLIDVSLDGRVRDIGKADMHIAARYSPDAQYILVKTIQKPFSYLVPLYRFPMQHTIWNSRGTSVFSLDELPLAEEIPIGRDSVRAGPRVANWRSDAPATVYWVSAADGGDGKSAAAVRDELFLLAAPFKSEPTRLAQLSQRFLGVQWSSDELALVWDDWWDSRSRRAFAYRPGNPQQSPVTVFDYSIQDAYADPGKPVMSDTDAGFPVLMRDDDDGLLLQGFGASPEGDQPFVRRYSLTNGDTTLLWQSAPPYYEEATAVLSSSPLQLLTQRESADSPPTYFWRAPQMDEMRPLHEPQHPYPALAGMQSELLRYQRADGVWLTAHLYLPAGYKKSDGPLPAVLWAYPLEYRSADDASQVTGSPYRFPAVSLRSMLPWLTEGYAIMDEVAMPVVGEGERLPNDTYVEQIVASAAAAIDEGARLGVVDRQRVAVAGHSYGAFMTANLLAYSDLFRAGVARSGAYNRTLTPFGFQREERTVWEAPDLYVRMSPMLQAGKINEPLLLVHGINDENSGTHPLQSERMFAALKGLGKDTRLVMLPLEGHSYLARESVLHQAAEISAWLARHVRDANATEQAEQ